MTKLTISKEALALLQKRNYTSFPLLLIVDDGGGDYSVNGGACSIGANFSIIALDNKNFDSRYPLKIENNANLNIYTSKYDLTFMGKDLILDIANAGLRLRNEEGLLTGNVYLAKAQQLAQAAKRGMLYDKNC